MRDYSKKNEYKNEYKVETKNQWRDQLKGHLKKLAAVALSTVTLSLSLAGCGAGADSASADGKKVVKLGVVGTVYEELWAPAKEKLAQEGIDLQIQQFSDYTTPNNALDNGEIDLNAFQHQIYLDTEVEHYNYKIQTVGYTFIIPLNLYSKKVKQISEIKDGDTIAIPNDVTNGGRAIKVLEDAGLITLKADASESPRVDDIENYNVKIQIKELAANTIPSVLPDVTAAIVNGNYALDYELKVEDAVYKDSSLDESIYWNLVAARSADLEDNDKKETYEKVIKAFQTDETKAIFDKNYGGYFIATGWDQDLLAK